MGDKRVLVRASVVGVNDSSVVYPCCLQCYTKLLHNLQQNSWHCLQCNIILTTSQMTWRYRLSLCIADSSASCHVSLFGGTLVPFFGCSANEFHRYVLSTCIPEEKIQHALELMLLGESYLFGLKSSLSTTIKQQKEKRTFKPVCLSDLLNSDYFHKGKLTDFVATQMIRSPQDSQGYSTPLTVVSVLKDLILHTIVLSPERKVIGASESIAMSSSQKVSCKLQKTCMSSDQTYFSEAKHNHELEGDQWQHSPMKKKNVSQADLSSDLSSQSTDLGWFTCDSSVEQAFSSQGDKHSCMDHQSKSLCSAALNLSSDDMSSLSTSLIKSENSFRISFADQTVELSQERQMMPNLKHLVKSRLNSAERNKIIMSRDEAHRHENLGEYEHDGQMMAVSSVSLEDNKAGLEAEPFHPKRCDGKNVHQLYENDIFLIRQDEEGGHSFSSSLNDSLFLVDMAEAASCQSSVSIMKSEQFFLENSSKVGPGTVKVLEDQNLAKAEDAFSSVKQVKKIQLGAKQKQKIDQMNNSTKSAALQDLNSSMVQEFVGSGHIQEGVSQSQSSAWGEVCSFDADLAVPYSEDISLFLNPVAVEKNASKPCTMTVTMKSKSQRESQEQYLKENKTFGLYKPQASRSHLKSFHGQDILTTGNNSFADQMIILRDSLVIPQKTIQLCRSEAVISPKIGVTQKQWKEEFTKKTLAENNFYPNDQVMPAKTAQVSSDVTGNQAFAGDLVTKELKHWKYQLSKPLVAKATFKCSHGDTYIDLGSSHNCDILPVLKDGFQTNKTLQTSLSSSVKPPASSEVPENKSQIDVLEKTSTSAEHNPSQSFLLSKKNVSRQTMNRFSSDFVAKEQPQSQHTNDGFDEFFVPFMEPWDLNDSVLVIEDEQNESVVNILSGKCQSTHSTHHQSLKQQFMQSGQENSNLKTAGINWSSQPLFSKKHQDKSEKNDPRCPPREDLSKSKRTYSFEFHSLHSGGTGSFNASTDLFNSQSQSNTSNLVIKDNNVMDCKELEKQTDVSDFIAHMENVCNSTAKDLLRFRGYLRSRGSHITDSSSAKIPAFTQESQDLMRQEVETPKCSTKKRVRFSRRHSRVSTIPAIDFLMARYPSPASSDQESTPTNTPLRSCLKREGIKQRETRSSLQTPTPDVAQHTTPLDTSTPLSTSKHWLNSPLDESQISGFWVPLSLSSKKMKISQCQTHSLKSCGRLTECCLRNCKQNKDKSCFCLDIADKENKVARRQLLEDSEGGESREHFSEITNQMFHKHSFLGSSFEMSPSHITKQTELTTERDIVSLDNISRQFYTNIKKGSTFNTQLVSIRQLDFGSDGSLVLFDESDLHNDGPSQLFLKPKRKTMANSDTNSRQDASRDCEIRSPVRTLMKLENNSQISREQHAQSEFSSPSLFSQ